MHHLMVVRKTKCKYFESHGARARSIEIDIVPKPELGEISHSGSPVMSALFPWRVIF